MFRKQRKPEGRLSPWYGFLLLAVIAVAFGLKISAAWQLDTQPDVSHIPVETYEEIVSPPAPTPDPTPTPDPVIPPEPTTPAVPEPVVVEGLKPQMNLAVPFTSQAPTGNWDPLHEDACEEASFYMVLQYYAGTPAGKIDPAVADPELQRLVHFGESLGNSPSISLAEAQEFLLQDAGVKARIIDNPSVEDIKRLIAAGKPVIVPALGQELNNPNFSGAGPLYHMYVIRGYTETSFITNDPGTRLGENYAYPVEVVMASIADWNNGNPQAGAKRILYLEP